MVNTYIVLAVINSLLGLLIAFVAIAGATAVALGIEKYRTPVPKKNPIEKVHPPKNLAVYTAVLGVLCVALSVAGNISYGYYSTKPPPFEGVYGNIDIGLWNTCRAGRSCSSTTAWVTSISDHVVESIGKNSTDITISINTDKLFAKMKAAQAFAVIGTITAASAAFAAIYVKQNIVVHAVLFAFTALSGVIVLAVMSFTSFFTTFNDDQLKLVFASMFEYSSAFGMFSE